jgi:hypothetical protein
MTQLLVLTSGTSTEASCIRTDQPGLKLYVIRQVSVTLHKMFMLCYV